MWYDTAMEVKQMEPVKTIAPVANKPIKAQKVTFDAFMAWLDEDIHAELENGEIIMASPASRTHQDIQYWLATLLRIYVQHHGAGWITGSPFQVRLRQSNQSREPDLVFLKTEHLDRLKDTYLDGAADLIVEIISPESINRDRGRKFVEYEREGVPEYWIIDPLRKQAEFYRLGEDKLYHLSTPDDKGVYYSKNVKGFFLKVDWLWQEPLPDELETLRQLGAL